MVLITPAHAQNKPVALDGPAIIAAFEGHSVAGTYVDGRPFRETYAVGGAIDYWEPTVSTTGQWSVSTDLFCTFYDALNGGCFRVVQVNSNCFDYYTASEAIPDQSTPITQLTYTARGSLTHLPSTCPVDLQT